MTTTPPTSPPPKGRPPQVGSSFGHYRIDGVVGVGGMGMVYSATDLRLGRQVALKVVLGHFAESLEFMQRFQREAAVLARLDSPHVISIYDHGEYQGWPYLVTQYAAGGDLGRALRQRGALPPALAATLCAQVSDALVDAHGVGVVHRDVKPANVLLRDERLDRLHVYLCDFGVAHTESSGLTTPGSVAGTWNYLAPERARGEPGTPSSDLYSVGCLFYEALTGHPPYSGTDVEVALAHLQSPVPTLPGQDDFTQRVNHIIARTMAKDPTHRYATASELREQLRTIGGGLSTPTPGSSPIAPHHRSRRRGLLAAAGAVVAAVAVAAAVVYWPAGGTDDPGPGPSPDPTPSGGRQFTTGDLDSNGFGDVAFGDYEEVFRLYSTGSAFKSPRPLAGISAPVVWGDVNGDDQLDLIEVDGTSPSLGVEVHYADRSTQASLLTTPEAADGSVVTPLAGDFNGDGRTDVAVATQQAGGESTVSVALSEEDGLGAATPWATLPGQGEEGVSFALGDFDGDERDDLVSILNDPGGPTRLQLLGSTGSAFEPLGEETAPEQLQYFYGVFRAGDFDGDGRAELAAIDSEKRVLVSRWDGTFSRPEEWLSGGDSLETPSNAAATDLDGDGDDDLAIVLSLEYDSSELRALVSDGEAFEQDEAWTTEVPYGYPDMVDSTTWNP